MDMNNFDAKNYKIPLGPYTVFVLCMPASVKQMGKIWPEVSQRHTRQFSRLLTVNYAFEFIQIEIHRLRACMNGLMSSVKCKTCFHSIVSGADWPLHTMSLSDSHVIYCVSCENRGRPATDNRIDDWNTRPLRMAKLNECEHTRRQCQWHFILFCKFLLLIDSSITRRSMFCVSFSIFTCVYVRWWAMAIYLAHLWA